MDGGRDCISHTHVCSGTPESIVEHKVVEACKRLNGAALVEDTCLAFDAMGGMPGPYIKVRVYICV